MNLFKLIVERASELWSASFKRVFHAASENKEMSAAFKERTASRIKEIDELLEAQLNEILHHPDFRALEATWRGLQYLLEGCGDGKSISVVVLNVTKAELLKDLTRALEA